MSRESEMVRERSYNTVLKVRSAASRVLGDRLRQVTYDEISRRYHIHIEGVPNPIRIPATDVDLQRTADDMYELIKSVVTPYVIRLQRLNDCVTYANCTGQPQSQPHQLQPREPTPMIPGDTQEYRVPKLNIHLEIEEVENGYTLSALYGSADNRRTRHYVARSLEELTDCLQGVVEMSQPQLVNIDHEKEKNK